MILDSRNQSVALDRSVQVAVVGAGPAGLALASALAPVAPVLVIESGGFGVEDRLQGLQAGECVGMDYPLIETRARAFGGSSGLWAGYCALFDPHDFAARHWVPGSGWPFGMDEIQPYYRKTAELLNLDEPDFDAHDIAARAGIDLPIDNASVVPTAWRFGTPTLRISEHQRRHFELSRDVTTLIHANVVDIRLNPERDAVTELVVRTLDGREGHIRADIFVLACGGIETARILLNADSQLAHGLGNSSDMVGRHFMEHPHLPVPGLAPADTDRFKHWLERGTCPNGRQFLLCLGLSPEVQAQAQILNARAHVYRTPQMREDETPRVGLFLEQAPNRDSRLTLSERKDALGLRRIRLDWRLTELDWKTYEQTAHIVAREFQRTGAGRLRVSTEPLVRDESRVLYSNHHLGTTRMSDNPDDGVVDRNCLTHDCSNLYIVGGSVFPTVSWANPTFTVIALTLRLADHLRHKLSPEARSARVA
jgi:choline dehydrogenase-like flavoprotein